MAQVLADRSDLAGFTRSERIEAGGLQTERGDGVEEPGARSRGRIRPTSDNRSPPIRFDVPVTTDRTAFARALSELRFTDAETLLADAGEGPRHELRAELEERRRRAEWEAQELHRRIIDLGAARSYPELVEIARREETPILLGLLSDSARDRAELFLRNAARWADGRRLTNRRHLDQARRALDALDVQLAAGVLARIDPDFLDEDDTARRDELLLEVSARRMELESLREAEQRLTKDHPSPDDRPWWRRWND